MDLSNYKLGELKELAAEVAAEMVKREKQAREDAIREIHLIAQRVGIPLPTLLKQTSTTRAPRQAQYVNPEDKRQTWSGFGRAPMWVTRHLAAGGSKEQLRAA